MFISRRNKNIFITAVVLCSTVFDPGLARVRRVISFASEYDSSGQRDPFVPLIGVSKKVGIRSGGGTIISIDDVVLQGIVINPDGTRSAIINGEVIPEGDTFEQVLIGSIGTNSVVVELNGQKHELKLYEENQ